MGVPNGAVAAIAAAGRALLRLEGAAEDALLARLAGTALELAEAFCGQALVARAFEDVVPARGWQALRIRPARAILGVTGVPVGAAPFVLPIETYGIDIDAAGTGWVRVFEPGVARIAVSYTAGLAEDWADVPAPVAQGVAMLVAHLFDHRERDVAPPAAVAALWRPYRRMQLYAERRA